MRRLGFVVLLLLLGACAGRDTVPLVECTSPRPQVCTMEYAPVCAQLAGAQQQEYSSACNACADDAVSGYVSGVCPDAK